MPRGVGDGGSSGERVDSRVLLGVSGGTGDVDSPRGERGVGFIDDDDKTKGGGLPLGDR